ncbi:unnamed protein product [Rotaria sp. Silwood2]|nr:unnamed protein product [Rotaria sp. Silwood2]CAF2809220.1 unnamed protein product [Rotaria sp. Silwood2]CAF2895067.1 unnamed protein product [Rotaria sp. Silwood2]CAF3476351.1 unnamed protein product [Rotaria sp. Silwood2]CAF4132417.1 unnamed protein product [Rotaria sp. Silwood2]
MQNSKISSNHLSSLSSLNSSHHDSTSNNRRNRLKIPDLSEYEYVGRLVTRERPIIRKSNTLHENFMPSLNTNKKYRSTQSHRQTIHEENIMSSDEDVNSLNKPFSVIKINDQHIREIYKLPTPPPEVKRVFRRLRSPEPKLIERIFVRRPTPEIIENIIEVPRQKVRIVNREKYLRQSEPIIRTKFVRLKRRHRDQNEAQSQSYIPSNQYLQQPTISTYTSQLNPDSMIYCQSSILPQVTLKPKILQAPCYTY